MNIYEYFEDQTNESNLEWTGLQQLGFTQKFPIPETNWILMTDDKLYFFVLGWSSETVYLKDGKHIPVEAYNLEMYGRLAGAEDIHYNFLPDYCWWLGNTFDNYQKGLELFAQLILKKVEQNGY